MHLFGPLGLVTENAGAIDVHIRTASRVRIEGIEEDLGDRNEEKDKKEAKSSERNTEPPASEDCWERKICKYGDLKDKKLHNKKHTQRSKSLRSGVANTVAFTHWYQHCTSQHGYNAKICAAKAGPNGGL